VPVAVDQGEVTNHHHHHPPTLILGKKRKKHRRKKSRQGKQNKTFEVWMRHWAVLCSLARYLILNTSHIPGIQMSIGEVLR